MSRCPARPRGLCNAVPEAGAVSRRCADVAGRHQSASGGAAVLPLTYCRDRFGRRPRKMNFRIFPVVVFGSVATNSNDVGSLKWARWTRAKSFKSSAVTCPSLRSTMDAFGDSPHFSCGTSANSRVTPFAQHPVVLDRAVCRPRMRPQRISPRGMHRSLRGARRGVASRQSAAVRGFRRLEPSHRASSGSGFEAAGAGQQG